jgi:hypothetical protein
VIDEDQFREEVVVPVLKYLEPEIPFSDVAVELLVGTATTESHRGSYIKQLGGGPALGVFQMEPTTHDDIWLNWLKYQPWLGEKVRAMRGTGFVPRPETHMVGNMYYAAAMARVHYRRVREALPPTTDAHLLGAYWKRYYNTRLGKGTVEQYVASNGD